MNKKLTTYNIQNCSFENYIYFDIKNVEKEFFDFISVFAS